VITVRNARPGEFDAVGALTAEAYLAEGQMRSDDPYLAVLAAADVRAADAELIVAVDQDGAVRRTVTFCPQGSPFREVAEPHQAEFRTLAVAPAARRQGVAELLVRACIQRAAKHGATAVVLSTSDWMLTAHRLYERLGFVRRPDLDWHPRPDVNLLGYGRELPDASSRH